MIPAKSYGKLHSTKDPFFSTNENVGEKYSCKVRDGLSET